MDSNVIPGAGSPSPAEVLYRYYSELSPADSPADTKMYAELESTLEKISNLETDTILQIVCRICEARERCAFQAGLQMGAQLAGELFRKKEQETL